MDGLIIPGGESTTMFKLIVDLGMFETLVNLITNGLPVLGTCAGLLLLAKEVENHTQSFLNLMDIKAKKNAYGRQLGSFRCRGDFGEHTNLEFVFIRAPYIVSASENVEILARHNKKVVAARQDNKLVTAFHPELSKNNEIHKYFLRMIKK
jgi:5'-phosphate synthase pdxT subunit